MVTSALLQGDGLFAGDFRLVRPLGKGGMGEVYLAEQISTGKPRALKLLHTELLSYASLRERFAQEARVGALIESDHVVDVVAAGVDGATGRPWLAMELLEGSDLAQLVKASGPIAPWMTRELMLQMCHALAAAHRAGIVHRDLKPENLFVARSRQQNVPFKVKVLDFGIAKLMAEARAGSHLTNSVLGTPLWMAPEQAEARPTVGPQADVWALGLLAFFMLTGRCYWRESTSLHASVVTLMREVLVEPMVPASVRAAQHGCADRVPLGFDAWFAACTARDPAQRFAHAGQAMTALEAVLPAANPAQPLWPWPTITPAPTGYPSAPAMTPQPSGPSQGGLAGVSAAPAGGSKSSRWAWVGAFLGLGGILIAGLVLVAGAGVALYFGVFDNPPSPVTNHGPDLSGAYSITSSQNPGGGPGYAGSVLLTRQTESYGVAWTIPGGQGYEGVGLVLDQTLGVGWSQGGVYGVCIYRVNRGKLRGRCAGNLSSGRVDDEELEGPAGLSGEYTIVKAGDGRSGKVTITPLGETFQFAWSPEAGGRKGVGIRTGDVLVVGWSPVGGPYGVVSYQTGPSQLVGKWALPGDARLGKETLARK